jgi:hypothetical protein
MQRDHDCDCVSADFSWKKRHLSKEVLCAHQFLRAFVKQNLSIIIFFLFFWRATECWPILCLCRPFMGECQTKPRELAVISRSHRLNVAGLRIRIDLMRIQIQFFSNCGSGFWIRIPDPDPGFDDLTLNKFTAGNFYFYFLDQKWQFSYP